MADRDSAEIPDPPLDRTRRMTEQERDVRPFDAPSLDAGQELAGRFRIVRRLGHGGMGEVYEAEDRELGETVALKTVLPSIARDPDSLRRFNREIHLARKVTHPNVCRIFDVFHDRVETDGVQAQEIAFFTMELLPGETLEQRLRRQGRMSSLEAGPIVRQMVDGLAAAHQAGVIHRDFKTANVMLVPGPGGVRAVITDFGLARAGAGHEAAGGTLTVRGDVLGSPLYMAPEQVTAGEITTATDIYTLGLVLYEMVTGRPPFVGDSVMATMVKRLQEPPPPPRLAAPDLDPAWNDAILRCLEIKPADRFKDIRDVLAALGGAEVEPGPSRRRLVRRRWLLAAAGLALVLLLAAIWILRPAGRPAVALLGFRNQSGNRGVDYVEAMLLSMLSQQLRAGFKLSLVSDDTVARVERELRLFKTESFSSETMERLHENLPADVVVYGSYRAPRPGEVLVNVNVKEVPSGEMVATFSEAGSEQDLFGMIDRLGPRLRAALGVGKLSPAEVKGIRKSRPSLKAARLYAEGLERLRVSDALKASLYFKKAVEAQREEYPLARLGWAKALQKLGYDRKAAEQAKLASAHSDRLPQEEKLQVEAQYREIAGQWDEAIAIYRKLDNLSSNHLEYGLRLAAAQTRAGRGKEALSTIKSLRTLPSGEDPRLDLAAAAAESDPRLRLKLAKTAEEKGLSQNAGLLVAQALMEQGRAYTSISQYQDALDVFKRARPFYDDVGDEAAVAWTLSKMGEISDTGGRYGEARRLFEEALAIFHRLGDRAGEAWQLNGIATVISKQRGEKAKAIEVWERAVQIYEEIGPNRDVVRPLNNMAVAYAELGKLAEARRQYEKTLSACRAAHNRFGEGVALANLADVLHYQGDLVGAKEMFEEALDINVETNDLRDYTLTDMARLLAAQGATDLASQKLQEALDLRRERDDQGAIAESQLAMAVFFMENGDSLRARSHAEQALAQFLVQSQPEQEAKARAVLARALAARGVPEKAGEEISTAERLAATSESYLLRMTVKLAAGQVRVAAGKAEEARRLLGEVLDQARSSGFAGLELEARLELGKLEAERGDRARGRALLAAVEKDAQARGFGRIAREARRLGGL